MSIDIFRESPAPPSPPLPEPRPDRPDWTTWFLWTLLAAAIFIIAGGRGVIPGPEPSPIDAEGLRVLVVEETESRGELTTGQRQALLSIDVREWLDEHCVKRDGQPARLFVDSDTPLEKHGDVWVKMREKASPPYPCVVVSDPPQLVRQKIGKDWDADRMIEFLESVKD